MANPSLQIGNDNWAIKEDNLLGYSTAGTRFVPQPITMTRATLGTRVNPSGLVEDVALLGDNLTTPLDFTTWINSSSTDITANSFTTSGSGQGVFYNLTTNKVYQINISGVTGDISIRYRDGGGAGTVLGAFDTDLYFDTSGLTSPNIYIRSLSATTATVTSVSIKEATIDNLPRVDYTDGTSSLLVEPQRTNLVTYSEDFSGWSSYVYGGGNLAKTYGYESPNGLYNATKFEVTLGTGGVLLTDNITVGATENYTLSVWMKGEVGGEKVKIDLKNTGSDGPSGETFTLTTDWIRYEVTRTNDGATNRGFQFRVTVGEISSDQTFYVYGTQLEEASYRTSYIKTSGSTVTRNQETYEKTGISDKINSEEGVLFVEMAALANDGTIRYLSINDGSTNNMVTLLYYSSSNNIRVIVSSGGTNYVDKNSGVSSVLDFHKVAVKWKVNDFALWLDGVEVKTDTSGSAPIGLNTLSLDVAGSGNFFGKVKQLQIFKTALTDSELATLTT